MKTVQEYLDEIAALRKALENAEANYEYINGIAEELEQNYTTAQDKIKELKSMVATKHNQLMEAIDYAERVHYHRIVLSIISLICFIGWIS